jgi:hypothetical protein
MLNRFQFGGKSIPMDSPPIQLSRIARRWRRCAGKVLVAGLLAMLA